METVISTKKDRKAKEERREDKHREKENVT
jgi:hypothetical protein